MFDGLPCYGHWPDIYDGTLPQATLQFSWMCFLDVLMHLLIFFIPSSWQTSLRCWCHVLHQAFFIACSSIWNTYYIVFRPSDHRVMSQMDRKSFRCHLANCIELPRWFYLATLMWRSSAEDQSCTRVTFGSLVHLLYSLRQKPLRSSSLPVFMNL